jgi:hypothetical protein
VFHIVTVHFVDILSLIELFHQFSQFIGFIVMGEVFGSLKGIYFD